MPPVKIVILKILILILIRLEDRTTETKSRRSGSILHGAVGEGQFVNNIVFI
jgi:hypothetical protein